MAIFSRNATTGALSFTGSLFDGIGGVDGLRMAWAVALSPDGEHVYVAGRGDNALAVFARDPGTGALTPVEVHVDGVDGVDGLLGAWSVAVSPVGAYVVVAGVGDDAVSIFSRDAATGALRFVEAQVDGVGGNEGLASAGGLAISPDGAHVYATGSVDDSVARFAVLGLADFTCYRAHASPVQFAATDVTLEGDFEPRVMTVTKPRMLCAPSDTNRWTDDVDTHLAAHRARLVAMVPGQSPELKRATFRVVDQFGEIAVSTASPDRLLVPTAVDLAAPPPPPDPNSHNVDHYKCYRVRVVRQPFCSADSSQNALQPCAGEENCGGVDGTTAFCFSPPPLVPGRTLALADQYGASAALELMRPSHLCQPADKNGEGIKQRHVQLMCYRAKRAARHCDDSAPQNPGAACSDEAACGGTSGITSFCIAQDRFERVADLRLSNQLGSGVLDLDRMREICVPAALR